MVALSENLFDQLPGHRGETLLDTDYSDERARHGSSAHPLIRSAGIAVALGLTMPPPLHGQEAQNIPGLSVGNEILLTPNSLDSIKGNSSYSKVIDSIVSNSITTYPEPKSLDVTNIIEQMKSRPDIATSLSDYIARGKPLPNGKIIYSEFGEPFSIVSEGDKLTLAPQAIPPALSRLSESLNSAGLDLNVDANGVLSLGSDFQNSLTLDAQDFPVQTGKVTNLADDFNASFTKVRCSQAALAISASTREGAPLGVDPAIANMCTPEQMTNEGSCTDLEFLFREVTATQNKAVRLVQAGLEALINDAIQGNKPAGETANDLSSFYTQACTTLKPYLIWRATSRALTRYDASIELSNCPQGAEDRDNSPKASYGQANPRIFPLATMDAMRTASESALSISFDSAAGELTCGATYLGGSYFMTAAHCIPSDTDRLSLIVNANDDAHATKIQQLCTSPHEVALDAFCASSDLQKRLKKFQSTFRAIVRAPADDERFFDFAILKMESIAGIQNTLLPALLPVLFSPVRLSESSDFPLDATYMYVPYVQSGAPRAVIYDDGVILYPPNASLFQVSSDVVESCFSAISDNASDGAFLAKKFHEMSSVYVVGKQSQEMEYEIPCSIELSRLGVCDSGQSMPGFGGALDIRAGNSGSPVFLKPLVEEFEAERSAPRFLGIVAGGEVGLNLTPSLLTHEQFLPSFAILSELQRTAAQLPSDLVTLLALER